MADPKITVLLPVHNAAAHLRTAVDSILAQEGVEFELLVIDDGSTDGSGDLVEAYRDPRIRFVRLEENQGLPRALNLGLEAAKGRLVARMDGDDESVPGRLAAQAEHLEQTGAVLVGSHWECMDDDGAVYGRYGHPDDQEEIARLLAVPQNLFPHGSFMFDREAVQEIGGYNEQFIYTQDLELMVRLARAGTIRIVEQVLYRHRSTPDTLFKSQCQGFYTRMIRERAAGTGQVEITDLDISTLRPTEPPAEINNLSRQLVKLGTFYFGRDNARAWKHIRRGLEEAPNPGSRLSAWSLILKARLGTLVKGRKD